MNVEELEYNVRQGEREVIALEDKLKLARASLAAAKKVLREASKKNPPKVSMTKVDELKAEFATFGWESKSANRKGKLYITVDQLTTPQSNQWYPPYKVVEKYFPKAHLTSGGCGNYTFRLNP